MKVLLAGCTGFIGTRLTERLSLDDHECFVMTRKGSPSPETAAPITICTYDSMPPAVDAVINLSGESVAGIWTEAKKERILETRIDTTRRLVDWTRTCSTKPKVLVSASAVGFYGDRGTEPLSEGSGSDPAKKFRSQVCLLWEREANIANEIGVRVVNLRLGNVLDPFGGFLGNVLRFQRPSPVIVPFSSHSFFPWVSLRDAVEVIRMTIVDPSIDGPINVVAPVPATYYELFNAVGKTLNKRVVRDLPSWTIRLALGEFSQAILESQRVIPGKLNQMEYRFDDPVLGPFIHRVLGPTRT